MNYPPLQPDTVGLVPPVNFPPDSRYYGFRHADLYRARRRADHLSDAADRAPAGRAELRDRCAAHRAVRATGWT